MNDYCIPFDAYLIYVSFIHLMLYVYVVLEVFLVYLYFLNRCVCICETENLLNTFETEELLQYIEREMSAIDEMTREMNLRLTTYDLTVAVYQPALF